MLGFFLTRGRVSSLTLSFALSFLFSDTAFSQRGGRRPGGPVAEHIDAAVRGLGVKDDAPGLGVVVIQNGRVVFKKGYGLANVEKKTPITHETTFELASVSKAFTSMAIMILHDRGRLNFTDQVRKVVPEISKIDEAHPILISHLLQHTSGLPEYTTLAVPAPDAKGYVSNADYAKEIAANPTKFKSKFAPGKRHDYCNTNYMLLALIIERVSGRSYGTFVRNNIFRPLEMTGAFVNENHTLAGGSRGGHAVGYTREKKGGFAPSWGVPPDRKETLLTTGDGSVWCSLDDMIQWGKGLNEKSLVKPATWREAMTPSHTTDGKTNPYGYGWSLELGNPRLTGYWHDGSWGGFQTSYYHSLARNRTIILLGNRSDINTDTFWKAIEKAMN